MNSKALILVADDDPVYRRLVGSILEKRGFLVTTVDDGDKVLPVLQKEAVRIVIMDLHMPEVNGFQATSLVRDAGYQTPIIALTVETRFGIIEECLAAGMNDYLEKPINKDKLLKALNRHLVEASVGEI